MVVGSALTVLIGVYGWRRLPSFTHGVGQSLLIAPAPQLAISLVNGAKEFVEARRLVNGIRAVERRSEPVKLVLCH